jgi:hypothetical protein
VDGWQAAGTIGTFCAVLIAVMVYVTNAVHRWRDQKRRSLTQARLVVTAFGNPGVEAPTNTTSGFVAALTMPFANYGDRPVLDIYFEVWPPRDEWPAEASSVSDVTPWAVMLHVVEAGQETSLTMNLYTKPNAIGGWRIRWTDADGLEWYKDRAPMRMPLRMR